MNFYIFLLSIIVCACTNKSTNQEVSIHSTETNYLQEFGYLYNDDIYILEVHYPETLQAIIKKDPLSLEQVLILHQIGINDSRIIHLIKYTSSYFMLTADDVVYLQLKGVSLKLINHLIEM